MLVGEQHKTLTLPSCWRGNREGAVVPGPWISFKVALKRRAVSFFARKHDQHARAWWAALTCMWSNLLTCLILQFDRNELCEVSAQLSQHCQVLNVIIYSQIIAIMICSYFIALARTREHLECTSMLINFYDVLVLWFWQGANGLGANQGLSSSSPSNITAVLRMVPMKIMNKSQITKKYSLMNFPPKSIEIQ